MLLSVFCGDGRASQLENCRKVAKAITKARKFEYITSVHDADLPCFPEVPRDFLTKSKRVVPGH